MTDAYDIIDTVKTRLETIKENSGFNTDAGENVHLGRRSLDESELPGICVFDVADEILDGTGYIENMHVELTIGVEGHAAIGADAAVAIDNLISDIKTAALDLSDRTLSGKTLDFGYAGREIAWPEDSGEVVTARLNFMAIYRETYGSP